MFKNAMLSALLFTVLSGCGTMSPPATLVNGQMKVVEIGSGAQETQEYVLHIPAGVPFPLRLYVHGSLMKEELDLTKKVRINRDIYLYRQWTSFDGINWMGPKETEKLLNFTVKVDLKGDGGTVDIFAHEK